MPKLDNLTPKQIIEYLNRYIIGQYQAKRSVSIALRNRWRRSQVPTDLRNEITPKNIIMIGPTGVGKTEIARRLAKWLNAPFVKVEASKFTEVGYVGRDVESIIRDLTGVGVHLVRKTKRKQVGKKARENAEQRVLDILVPPQKAPYADDQKLQSKFAEKLASGELDQTMIQVNIKEQSNSPTLEMLPLSGNEGLDMNLRDMVSNMMPKSTKKKKVSVKEALQLFEQEEAERLIDKEELHKEAIQSVEENGIVFLDEIDKIVQNQDRNTGGEISRQGVQRDLLPIVEGSTVTTKYGAVNTEHILFIAAGAFHTSKPADLIPELQGRFPIRVELNSLTQEDFAKILTETKNSLPLQYSALLKTEGIILEFDEPAIEEIAHLASVVNEKTENIGARRLHTIMERLLDEISFNAPDLKGQKILISKDYVLKHLKDIVEDQDLSRYIL